MIEASTRKAIISLNKSPAYKKKDWLAGYLFIAPMVIGILVFVILPIFFSLYLSFVKWDGLNIANLEWVGLENFKELFTIDPKVRMELKNTIVFTFLSVPLTIAIACVVSVALIREVKYSSALRCIYYLPNVTMSVAVGLVWSWIFNSQFGVVKQVLAYIGVKMPNLLGNPNTILYIVIFVSIWKSIGASMIIIIAALQGIPQSYFEAADIDGANSVVKFFRITVPLITPSIFFLLITGMINGFKAFDLVYIFARGGGSSTTLIDGLRTMVFGIYNSAFEQMRMGYASAKALLLFVVILIFTLIQFILQKRWVHYE